MTDFQRWSAVRILEIASIGPVDMWRKSGLNDAGGHNFALHAVIIGEHSKCRPLAVRQKEAMEPYLQSAAEVASIVCAIVTVAGVAWNLTLDVRVRVSARKRKQ